MKIHKMTVAAMAAMVAVSALAGKPEWTEVTPLWPTNQMPMATENLKRQPNIGWYPAPAKTNGVCMILISGGGYNGLCDGFLLSQWNRKLSSLGIQCVSLQYRTRGSVGKDAEGKCPWKQDMAQADAQRAVRLVRSMAKARGYSPDKIGAMGMSAGAHLTARLAASASAKAYDRIDEIDDLPCNVNFAITAAIAYGLKTERSKRGPLLGPDFAFDDQTPPMCMLHGGGDGYSPLHSTAFYRRLREKGLYAELHLYAGRKHGFWGNLRRPPSIDEQATYDNWFEPMEDFLAHLGLVAKPAPRALPATPDESLVQILTAPGTEKDPARPTMYLLTDATADSVAPTVAAIAEWEALRAKKVKAELHTLTGARPDARAHRVWEYLNGNKLNPWKPAKPAK